MYKELQVVKARRQLSDKVLEGYVGTIVYVHFGYPQAYEVEFVNSENETIEVLLVMEKDIIHCE